MTSVLLGAAMLFLGICGSSAAARESHPCCPMSTQHHGSMNDCSLCTARPAAPAALPVLRYQVQTCDCTAEVAPDSPGYLRPIAFELFAPTPPAHDRFLQFHQILI
jgi:hypothetical protein